ncbi:MAG: four helix bundle protein [Anaerolineae bacterium]|nr:four helix bundle protein [Anaerolineae bacterium]
MNYDEWEQQVPQDMKGDPLWQVEVYRLGLFIADLGWHDVTKLINDKRTRGFATLLSRALGNISAHIAASYSSRMREERARLYDMALSAIREARDWYYKGRHVLGEAVTWHRVTLLTQMIHLLQAGVRGPQSAVNRETLEALLRNVIMG